MHALFLQGGNLRQALTDSSDGELKWDKKGATIALDIVRGLHFLHSHGVGHYSCTVPHCFTYEPLSLSCSMWSKHAHTVSIHKTTSRKWNTDSCFVWELDSDSSKLLCSR